MSQTEHIDTNLLAAGVCAGERSALAQALNLLDDQRPAAKKQASVFLAQLAGKEHARNGHLIGITGPPGAGKSSLSATLISQWRQRGRRVGVLAVDPSSPISGGALLGDRLRMKTSSEDDGVFVRSLSSRGEFGGLAAEVWPMSLVMLAAFDIVLIETVGVGQREVDISRMCDTTCFVAQPGSGDSVQFLKAGILEVPHILIVNKADMGDVATRTLAELEATLTREHIDGGWQVPVVATSATHVSGIESLADTIESHYRLLVSRKDLQQRRINYQAYWIHKRLLEEFGSFGIARLGGEAALIEKLQQQALNPFEAYEALRQQYLTHLEH